MHRRATNAESRRCRNRGRGHPSDSAVSETSGGIFFAKIPNTITIDNEKYYQTIFFAILKLIGARIDAEVSTNIGRIDAVIKTADHIYIFEFKLSGTAEQAMAQIHDKQYAEPYLDDGRPVTLVGAAFDKKQRNLGHWLIEPASR